MEGDYPGYLEIIDKENPQLDFVLCENKDKLDNREKLTWLHFTVKNKAWGILFYGHPIIRAILSSGSYRIALSARFGWTT